MFSGDNIDDLYDYCPSDEWKTCLASEGLHRTSDGRKIPLVELTDSHLLNIIRYWAELNEKDWNEACFYYLEEAKRRGIEVSYTNIPCSNITTRLIR